MSTTYTIEFTKKQLDMILIVISFVALRDSTTPQQHAQMNRITKKIYEAIR